MSRSLTRRTIVAFAFCIALSLAALDWPLTSVSARRQESAGTQPRSYSAAVVAYARRSNHLYYHAPTGKVYASIPGSADPQGNSIARIDPATGAIENAVWIGSEPNKLRLAADGLTLYVGLDGSRTIRRFDLMAEAAGDQFSVGLTRSDGPLQIVDFATGTTDPNLIAVSRNAEGSSGSRGVAVFDNGVQRPTVAGESHALVFAGSDTALMGSAFYSNSGIHRHTVDASGIASTAPFNGTARGTRLFYSNGRIYTSYGHVVNAATGELLGTFPLPSAYTSDRPFLIDSTANQALYIARDSSSLRIDAFDLDTFVLVGSVVLPNLSNDPTSVVRWGSNGLAISFTSGPTRFIQSDLVGPGAIMPAAAPPTTPPDVYSRARFRRIDIRNNDLLFNPHDGRIYLTVPGSAGVGLGNTITRVDPVTAVRESSVFIGSEPNVMTLSDDGSTIQASLNGAGAVRSFDTGSGTAGLQFVPANDGYATKDLAVLPGTTQSVVVSAGNGGVNVYDSGVIRPSSVPFYVNVGPVEAGPSGVIYGYNDESTGFNLYKMSVTAQGLSVVSDVSNLIFRFSIKMKYAAGRLYASDGRVVDPEASRILGKFPVSGIGTAVEVDLELRKAYFAYQDRIEVFDLDTYNRLGMIQLPSYADASFPADKLVRWGHRGLAARMRGSAGDSFMVVVESPLIRPQTAFDLDGDARADVSVFRPEEGSWYLLRSRDGFGGFRWGIAGDRPVAADYDGDGKTDVAIFRDGVWWVINSNGGGYASTQWGIAGDKPVPADYDGDGRADLAVYRDGTWWIWFSNGGYTSIQWGIATDIPVPADFDGDGRADLAVYRDGEWWVSNSNGGGYSMTRWGIAGDKPVQADYDGDGRADLAVFREGTWWVINSNGGSYSQTQWGLATDKPVPADYDGDGRTDIAIYRDGEWWIMNSGGGYASYNWGLASDVPIPLR